MVSVDNLPYYFIFLLFLYILCNKFHFEYDGQSDSDFQTITISKEYTPVVRRHQLDDYSVCCSVIDNTRTSFVISLCSNLNRLISLIPPPPSPLPKSPRILDMYSVVVLHEYLNKIAAKTFLIGLAIGDITCQKLQ